MDKEQFGILLNNELYKLDRLRFRELKPYEEILIILTKVYIAEKWYLFEMAGKTVKLKIGDK